MKSDIRYNNNSCRFSNLSLSLVSVATQNVQLYAESYSKPNMNSSCVQQHHSSALKPNYC